MLVPACTFIDRLQVPWNRLRSNDPRERIFDPIQSATACTGAATRRGTKTETTIQTASTVYVCTWVCDVSLVCVVSVCATLDARASSPWVRLSPERATPSPTRNPSSNPRRAQSDAAASRVQARAARALSECYKRRSVVCPVPGPVVCRYTGLIVRGYRKYTLGIVKNRVFARFVQQ